MEPTVDTDPQSAIDNPQSAIDVPFPMGWITGREVENMLQVTYTYICHLVKQGKLQRRKRPPGKSRAVWLYDSVELDNLAEARLDKDSGPVHGKSLTWWGSRANPMELTEFNCWICLKDAANILGILPDAVGGLCDRGVLPAKQKAPGKRGSPVFVPHHQVLRLQQRPEYQQRLKWRRGERTRSDEDIEQKMEDWLPGKADRMQTMGRSLRMDHGVDYNTVQVAKLLGISRFTVGMLRARGRLEGHKSDRTRKGQAEPRSWWFYLKKDVDALQADPAYNDRHNRWIKTRNAKAGR